jgi:light-regulated signal transduction histidine kinase (bacteriophytochrome)
LRKIQLISSRIISKEEEMSVNVLDSIKRMSASAARMQTLLIDILKYTRLRHTDDAFEMVNLNTLIEEVKAEMAETINEAVITADPLPEVKGIPFLLKQLFSNLIANSVKYATPGRQPNIKITAAQAPLPYSHNLNELYHVIYVADNGIGFDQQFAESIFNIFSRLHTASEYKGSGVGLALCKKIMQNHSGYIAAASTPGEGTVMSIYFPVT